MEDSLQNGTGEGSDVDMQALFPFGNEDGTLHKARFLVTGSWKGGSPTHGKFLYNNDYRMVGDYHINFHRRTVIYQSRPSFSQLQCVAQHMISTRVLGKEGMECQGYFRFVVYSSFSLV